MIIPSGRDIMATYFHGSNEIQPESIQTLYLMNPNFTSYSNTLYPQTQHLVGIPVQSNNGLSLSLPVSEIANRVLVRNEEVNITGLQSVLRDSKYLKFAQQLLDEVVNVGKGMKDGSMKSNIGGGNHVDREDENKQESVELTISERQELQMKKAKLVNMLDEVIQRYQQYRQQMQVVVSSFEAAAGTGSAKSYTSLALQTISKQFRSLRDAITGKIRAIAKSLGEEEFFGGTNSKGSRLQFVDQQVRQQKALQQLGMIHHNAWRPQRGLPERSVSVLRAWLFEHFLHPYPKDSDKKMLAKRTGLTRSQVSNWFINARVRLWKPMVEEMYKEEMKGQEHADVDERTSGANANEDSSSKSNAYQDSNPQAPIITIPPSSMNVHNQDDNLFIQSELKKTLSEEAMNGENENNGYNGGGFEEYSNIREIERFGLEQFASRFRGNNVSLTLGLTHYDGLSLSEAQPAYLSNNSIPFGTNIEISSENNAFSNLHNNLSVAHSSNAYENISRKRFASQLLPDFVA